MKQKLKRLWQDLWLCSHWLEHFTNGTTAFAASPQANIAFWNASVKNSGEASELKPGYNHGKILYSILDGNSILYEFRIKSRWRSAYEQLR